MKRNGTAEHIIPANDLNDKNNNIDLRIWESRDILRVGQLGISTVAYLRTWIYPVVYLYILSYSIYYSMCVVLQSGH